MLKQAVIHMKNQLEVIRDNDTQESIQENITNNKSKNKDLENLHTEKQYSLNK